MIFYKLFIWMHLLSMASLFGLLVACRSLPLPLPAPLLKQCKTFFGLVFVSGVLLAYLKIITSLDSGDILKTGIYHILITKFALLMGLGHFVMVGSKKESKTWINISLVAIALATFLGLMIRYQ
ncbi:hypothetical protein AB834_05450 [PVC group bacterium (ex Bugula neritina AB1)]|nr:hypothetical protein AB834_05450 [PVC group bacterium (ex Bugula neritina AB1)]